MTTKTGAIISKQSYDSQVQISKNSQGNINSITSSRDGMLSFSRSSNNLTISQYGVSQASRHVQRSFSFLADNTPQPESHSGRSARMLLLCRSKKRQHESGRPFPFHPESGNRC